MLSTSTTYGRIVSKRLQQCGVSTEIVRSPRLLGDLADGSNLLFLDWDHSCDSYSAKNDLCLRLKKSMGHRFFAVASTSEEAQVLRIFADTPHQVLFTPLSEVELAERVADARNKSVSQMQLDVDVINAFLDASANSFEFLARLDIDRQQMRLIAPTDANPISRELLDVTVLMEFQGEYVGAVVISMTHALSREVTVRALDKEDVSAGDVRDCIGELVNVLSGEANKVFENTPYSFQMALPQVIEESRSLELPKSCEDAPILSFVFTTGRHRFLLYVAVRPLRI